MPSASAKKLWTKTRIDVLGHKSTHWFSEREHGLRLQCQCANQAGVLERSIVSMARIASGDGQTVTVTPEEIARAISRLASTGHVVWFREFEVLWWVEMADEQEPDHPTKRAEFWANLVNQLLPKLVNQVRVSIRTRYPQLGSGKIVEDQDTGQKLVNQVGLFGSLDRDQDRDLDRDRERNPSRRTATRERSRGRRGSKRKPDIDADLVDRVIECMNEHRAAVIDNATGFRLDSTSHRGWVEKATAREKATLDDWRLRIANLAEAASRDPFWVPHLTIEHLHWRKNWERWAHESSIPAHRRDAKAKPSFAPGDFSKPENRTSRGIEFGPNIDPNAEEAL